jgi:hypothetical protein
MASFGINPESEKKAAADVAEQAVAQEPAALEVADPHKNLRAAPV